MALYCNYCGGIFCSKHETNDDSDDEFGVISGYYYGCNDLLDWESDGDNHFIVSSDSDDFSDSECKSQDNEIKVNEQDFFDDVNNQ